MKAIAYSEILASVADELGWDAEALDAVQFRQSRRAISTVLARVEEYCFWPELVLVQERTFHPEYDDAEAVAAGTVRFFPPTGEYYTALRATTGNEPASWSGGEWVINLSYWSLASRELSADLWEATDDYAQGDQVYDPVTFLYYQAHTNPPVGALPTNTTYWGQIEALNPCIPYTGAGLDPIGLVEGVYTRDPRVFRYDTSIPYERSAEGIQVREVGVNKPWVRFLRRPPKLVGDYYDVTASYEPVDEEDYLSPTVLPDVGEDYVYWPTLAQAQAVVITASRVDLGSDGNGRPGTFLRDITYTGATDGVDGFTDSVGTKFRRIVRE